LNLIGCGRVGQTLARLLSRQVQLQDLYSRSQASRENALAFIGTGTACASLADMRAADVWLLAVPDSQIGPIAEQLAQRFPAQPTSVNTPPPIVFHCSGFWASSVLSPLAQQGWATASLHPVMSFASPALAVQQFAQTPCALEGAPTALSWLRPTFERLGAQCFEIPTERKALYHAAAVFSNNFTVVLQAIAQAAWEQAGVPNEWLAPLTRALLDSASTNVLALGPQKALTGPAARGDQEVLTHQARVVQAWDPLCGQAYQIMSELALRLKQADKVNARLSPAPTPSAESS
jgi:predicted short-subunit dehydrogenase-like oxidoreductase (DUF2520 family)